MERRKFVYDGETFEEGELVLVNGKELMYCRFVEEWMEGEAMFAVYAPRNTYISRYEPHGMIQHAANCMRSTYDGDRIEHVYDPTPYNAELQPARKEHIVNGYIIDGWVICIILMFVTLIFKPVGLWPLLVLGVWLELRHEEIMRIKNMKK